jgi:hypothetical protein
MTLWMMMFALGLLGFAGTFAKMAPTKKTKSTILVIKDENGEERFVVKSD